MAWPALSSYQRVVARASLPSCQSKSHLSQPGVPGRRNRSAESKEHVLYYDNKQEQWTEDKADVVEQPLTTSTRLRRCWDEEEPAPRDTSAVKHTPLRPPYLFSQPSVVSVCRSIPTELAPLGCARRA
jgi:hypothetical protein